MAIVRIHGKMPVSFTRLNRIIVPAIMFILLTAALCAYASDAPVELGQNEIKLGEEVATEIAKQYKLSDNAADLKRVREIGAKLAQVVNKTKLDALYGSSTVTPFEYKFDIIEENDVNAFCIPGGHIYIYRGLLDYVQSDHELALIIAHECTHAAHHHMVYLQKKQESLEKYEAYAFLATIISGAKTADASNILNGMALLNIARVNGYGNEAERDADAGAIRYAIDAGYNPVGLLTFMERMAHQPEYIDWGIYRSHPLNADRIAAAKKLLAELGVPISRRAVTKAVIAEVTTEKIDKKDIPGVMLSGKLIYRPSATDAKTSLALAQAAAERINSAFDSNINIHELKLDSSAATVTARGTVLIHVSDADAALMNSTPDKVAQAICTSVKNVVLMQMVDTVH